MIARSRPFHVFAQWISFLWLAVPVRLQPTFLELIMGLIMVPSGQICGAILAVGASLSWTAYQKAIRKGRFSWLAICRQWLRLLMRFFPRMTLTLAEDDTFTPRASRKAPSVGIYYDHSRKPNRPSYMQGQLRVALTVILIYGRRTAAFPLLWRLQRIDGNRSKLETLYMMVKVVLRWVPTNLSVRLLLDAWYMKGPLLLPLIKKGIIVIGQVRRDAALYFPPERPSKPSPSFLLME